MSLSWPPHDPAAAAAAAAAAAWPWHAAQSLAPPPAVSSPPAVPCAATTALLAQYGLQAPLASHACPGAAAGALAAAAVAERVRRDSLMWPLDLEPGPAASAAAAPHLPPPLDLASAAVGRSGSCTSAQSVCSAAGSVIGSLATSGSGALRARSSSSDCSPSLGSSSTAACGGAFCSPVSCSVGGGGGGAAGGGGTPSPRGRLQQQLAQLQREQEQQAIKLHMLQLQCQGGFMAAPAPPALSSAGLMGGF
ncbi:hypothetical protein MNEG_15237 [Monoraphidium neglectum]|uniref:Uncharacterized protein n=1 Tax=Monoraphidium neglectum TaxID=145388 RepID=A0A0D2LSG8_9CHLO|nr:hypothetical protein MNEG_15237 [Monoraphidium neglectum]KIY92726.1 hypothetical protein MNEG_15237 [Monoraphidium neglectum]|eukprot:XP_013891746.1 hypothetical protein MNEG_15237 [Monoraphidium neglectum]